MANKEPETYNKTISLKLTEEQYNTLHARFLETATKANKKESKVLVKSEWIRQLLGLE